MKGEVILAGKKKKREGGENREEEFGEGAKMEEEGEKGLIGNLQKGQKREILGFLQADDCFFTRCLLPL